jgi:PPM family protein phosphatase
MRIASCGSSDVGRRSNNEDAFLADDSRGLYVVADGMGGYEGGEIASGLVVDSLRQYFDRMEPAALLGLSDARGRFAMARSRIDMALRITHRDIARKRVGRLAQMGSTVAMLVVQDGQALIAHVGDSRVHRIRAGTIELLTRDHSLYAEMEAAGNVALPPRSECSFQHVITRALGIKGDSHPDVRVERAEPGDLFLLSTDGVTDVLTDEHLLALSEQVPLEFLAEDITRAAYEAGSEDNVTALAVRIL